MFPLVKWAYNLGVQHERRRIADHLNVQANINRRGVEDIYHKLNNEPMDEDYAKEMRLNLAVRERIGYLVGSLFEPLYSNGPTESESVMFPKEGK